MAVKRNKRIYDDEFRTLRGARIAFSKHFIRYSTPSNRKLKGEWTPFYHPEQKFLDQLLGYSSDLGIYGEKQTKWEKKSPPET